MGRSCCPPACLRALWLSLPITLPASCLPACLPAAQVIEPVRSRCLCIRVAAPSQQAIEAQLQAVAGGEKLSLPPHLAARLAAGCDRNLRRALLSLEACKVQQYPFDAGQEVATPDWEMYIQVGGWWGGVALAGELAGWAGGGAASGWMLRLGGWLVQARRGAGWLAGWPVSLPAYRACLPGLLAAPAPVCAAFTAGDCG